MKQIMINSLVLPKEKMKDMDKIRTGLAAFGMSGQVFHAPFISTTRLPVFQKYFLPGYS